MSSFPTNFDWTTVNLCQSIFDRSDDSTAIKFMQLAPEVFPQFINETNHPTLACAPLPHPLPPATQSRTTSTSGSTTHTPHHTHVSDTDTTQSNETVLAEDELKAAQSLFNLIMLQHASNQHKHQRHHRRKHDVNHKHAIMHSKHNHHHQPHHQPPHSHHLHPHPHPPQPHLKTMTMMPMPMMMTNLSPTELALTHASKASFNHHHNGHHHHHPHVNHSNHPMNAVHAMNRRRQSRHVDDEEEEEEDADANESMQMEFEMQHMMEELSDECAHSMMRSAKFVAHSRAFVQCFECLDRMASTSISSSSSLRGVVRTPKSQSLNASISMVDEERPHACRYCEKRFETRAALNKHHNTHSGYRKFACKVCGRRYVQKWRWERHEPQCTLEMQRNEM